MQDSGYEDAVGSLPVEHDVASVLNTLQTGANIVAGPSEPWVIGHPPATGFTIVKITDGLLLAPGAL